MLLFLERHYPVSRIKQNRHFKRGIVLDGGHEVFLNESGAELILMTKLDTILTLVFDTDAKTNLDVLAKFLNLRPQKKKIASPSL